MNIEDVEFCKECGEITEVSQDDHKPDCIDHPDNYCDLCDQLRNDPDHEYEQVEPTHENHTRVHAQKCTYCLDLIKSFKESFNNDRDESLVFVQREHQNLEVRKLKTNQELKDTYTPCSKCGQIAAHFNNCPNHPDYTHTTHPITKPTIGAIVRSHVIETAGNLEATLNALLQDTIVDKVTITGRVIVLLSGKYPYEVEL